MAVTPSGAMWRWSAEAGRWCELGTTCEDGRPSSAPAARNVTDIRLSPEHPATVYVAAADDHAPSRAGVYVSDDFGGTWHRVTRLHCGDATSSVAALGVGGGEGNAVWAVGPCEVARSDDGGVTCVHRPLAVVQAASVGVPDEVLQRIARPAQDALAGAQRGATR